MRFAVRTKNWPVYAAGLSCFILIAMAAYGALRYAEDRATARLYAEIARLCLQAYDGEGETIPDRLRRCVHAHTAYGIDDEFYARWKDRNAMAGAMFAHLSGKAQKKPSFECATRAGLMIALLESQGIKAQDLIVARFDSGYTDHVVVGVRTADGASWTVHDPSYDVFMADAASKIPATAHELLLRPLTEFVPCTGKNKCGWDIVSGDKMPVTHLIGLWGIMAYKDFSGDWDLLYNKEKFNPYQVLGGQSYCEKRRKHCNGPPVEIGTLH